MVERVATAVGLVHGRRRSQARVLRVAAVVAAVLMALLAVGFGTGVLTPPRPTPSPAPTRDPAFTPQALQAQPAVSVPGATQIAADATSVWVADRNGGLSELDPASGAILRSIVLPRIAADILVTTDSVWASTASGNLLRVDRGTLAISEVPASLGVALAAGRSAIWLGGTNQVLRIDPAANAVTLRVGISQRGPELGIAVTDGATWVATSTQILRLDPTTGDIVSSIAGDAARLAVANDAVWATRGTELVRIDATSGAATTFVPGFPGGGALAADADHLWVGGPPGGGGSGVVVGASSVDGWIELTGVMPASVLDLAADAGTLWLTPDEGDDSAAIYRFAIP